MDKLFIRRLEVPAKLGILPWEQENQQPVYVDMELAVDTGPASDSDDIDQATDYARIRERIIDFLHQHRFNLVETLAERLAECLMREFPIVGCRLSVTKPRAFEDAEGVGVTIERGELIKI